jgi:hypothetical protein
MYAAESETGELQYLNFGPKYQGFLQDGRTFSLLHQVKTDIAVWLPSADLFLGNNVLAILANQKVPDGGTHLQTAMQSALEAILRATALKMGVADREIGGLIYPFAAGQIGFVLFDESSGGGGAVLPLVLTGNPKIDADRKELIRNIIQKAIELCGTCDECNQQTPFDQLDLKLPAVSREEWIVNPDPLTHRVRQSCYKCLRTYDNQRVHHLLDRGDAVVVLKALISPLVAATPVERCYDIPKENKFVLDALPRGMSAGKNPNFRRISADEVLTGSFSGLVQLPDGEYVAGQVAGMAEGVFRYVPRNAQDGLNGCDIQREQIVARLI